MQLAALIDLTEFFVILRIKNLRELLLKLEELETEIKTKIAEVIKMRSRVVSEVVGFHAHYW